MGTPNDIYHHTRSSLISIVSANVADNTLESVLHASGLNQETVNADHMMQLIRGPIYREFQTIVPKEGLKRQLTKLIGELQKVEEEPLDSIGFTSLPAMSVTQPTTQQTNQEVHQQANGKAAGDDSKKAKSKKAPIRGRKPGLTVIDPNAIGVPRAYFRDPRDDAFSIQQPLFGTDPHVVIDNGTRAILRYWVSEVALLDLEEIKKAGFGRYSFLVEEESFPNPTIVKLLEMLREEEEAEQEALMLERLAVEAKAAAERDTKDVSKTSKASASQAIQLTPEDIQTLVGQYAQLEEVRFIASLRRDGEVLNSKGRGLDIDQVKGPVLESLARLSLPHFEAQYPEQTQLFSRCKSILVQHQSGLLYLLEYVDTIVLIYGTNDLNLGLMYSYAASAGIVEEDSELSTELTSGPTDEDFKEMA